MFCHEVLSDFNCFQKSCISTIFYQFIWLWKLFHSFFVLLQKDFLVQVFPIEGVGVIFNKSAGAKSGSDCSATTSLPVLVWQILYSSHKSETAPWILSWLTEMIMRKKQFQSFHHRHRSVSIIFHLLCFWAFLETMDSWLGKLGVRFLRILIIIDSATRSNFPPGLSLSVEYHFVSDPSPRNDQRPAGNLFGE